MMKLFNFHTHNISESFGIVNHYPASFKDGNGFSSCGIHPWHYLDTSHTDLEIIENLAIQKRIVAIGETGLDPKSPVNIDKQIEILKCHIDISEEYGIPLILHCVKYFNEIIRLHKQIRPKQAWVLHGFSGKNEIAKQLVNEGFYLSINNNLLKNTSKAQLIIETIGLDKLFIETDDSDENITNNYNFVANYFNLSIEELERLIFSNLIKVGINVATENSAFTR